MVTQHKNSKFPIIKQSSSTSIIHYSIYNVMHTVDFPTRFQNGNSSAIDIIFVNKSRMQLYEIFRLSNALSDHEAQCIILNRFFPELFFEHDR